MKFAFSTLGCPGWSWNEIFATAKDLGLDGVEIRGIDRELYAPRIPAFCGDAAAETVARMQKAHMQLCMLSSNAALGLPDAETAAMNEARAYIALAQKLGVPYVRVFITPTAEPAPADVTQARRLYTQLCREAAGTGVLPLIETAGVLGDSRAMAAFLEGDDPATSGVLWDIHHPYRFFGETPEETYARIGPYIRYTHVKDSVMKDGQPAYRMMGYGDVPVLDTLRLLNDHGYDGFVTLEWVKRWQPDLQEPGIVFSHFINYMNYLVKLL